MSLSVLVRALLSSGSNLDLLFHSLCWTADAPPDRDRVEALAALVLGLGQRAEPEGESGPGPGLSLEGLEGRMESIIWDQCVPLLSSRSRDPGGGRTAAVLRLLGACAALCGAAGTARLVLSVLPVLQGLEAREGGDSQDGPLGPGQLSVELAVEVLSTLVPSLCSDEDLTRRTLIAALSCIQIQPEALASRAAVGVLLVLLGCLQCCRSSRTLDLILDHLYAWHSRNPSSAVTGRTLLVLTVLSDRLFHPGPLHPNPSDPLCGPDPRLSPRFWRIVQDGLTHRDNGSRKRALFLLKRCVTRSVETGCPCSPGEPAEEVLFWWDPQRSRSLRDLWEDYVLVLETLEENQIHVVRPVLNRIDVLIQTTGGQGPGPASSRALLHPSWLLCVYQRMFHSENKSLMREGAKHLLQRPQFAASFPKFIVGPFMDVLSDSSLFHRAAAQRVGACPELGEKLRAFMETFFRILRLQQRGAVLLQLIQHLGKQRLCAVPLLFLTRALCSLPPAPLLGADGLRALREVLRCTMLTHQVSLRAAAQCFLLHSALCLTDLTSVTLDDVFSLLIHFRSDESLRRGTPLWTQLVVWLSDNEGRFKIRPEVVGPDGVTDGGACSPASVQHHGSVRGFVQWEIEAFLQVPASSGVSERLPDPEEAEKLSRAVLLCLDLERWGPDGVEVLLRPLLDTLSRLSTNAYLPQRKTDKSLQLLLGILGKSAQPAGGGEEADELLLTLRKLLLKVEDSIQEFILRRLSGELQELSDVQRAGLYLSVLVLLHNASPRSRGHMQRSHFPKLTRSSLKVLQQEAQQVPSVHGQVKRAVAMASLAAVCSLVQLAEQWPETLHAMTALLYFFFSPNSPEGSEDSYAKNINQTLLKPLVALNPSDAADQAPVLRDWGRVASQFIRDQWICLGFLVKSTAALGSPVSSVMLRTMLRCSVEALALLPSDLVLPVLAFMETALPQVALSEEELCVEAMRRSWELVQGLSSNPNDFWPVLKGFVLAAFHYKLLELKDSEAPRLTAILKQISRELLDLSQSKSGVFNVLVEHCCRAWLPVGVEDPDQAERRFSAALSHINILVEACVYGPVFRRDQRLIQEVQDYVEQLGEECSANMVLTGDSRDEQFPRVCVVSFLLCLQHHPLQVELIQRLVLRLLEKDEDISRSKVRYYCNSLQHRVKNRVWQTLLLLLPRLSQGFLCGLLQSVFSAAFCSNQASVKYLMEWTMILILLRCPLEVERLWPCFATDQEKTRSSVCSFLSVLVHFSVFLPELQDQAAQWLKALNVALQWCFSHNFSVRLYALLALKRLWSLGGVRAEAERGPGGLGGLSSVVRTCLDQAEAMQSSGNANKNWSRIQDHFFFHSFHPVRDLSVETVFHTFPSLSELADDEWIRVEKFEKFEKLLGSSERVELRNRSEDLKLLPPGDWVQEEKGEQTPEECWAEVQKKIIPWRLAVQAPGPDLQLGPPQRALHLGKPHGGLLVVASLINKATNLGGLCRTCEIFGASGLVLDSLRHVSDKHFLSLSVSSELWLPLLEVKPAELARFLQQKKSEGFCIVGAEQTANSRSLKDFLFPQKTLLLLGNEREGVPADLLQLLDVCVEIPQQGVVRSLNVHVSAALLVWEYTRQHLDQQASLEPGT